MYKSLFKSALTDRKFRFLPLLVFLFASYFQVSAQGDLMVYPTRLVFNGTNDRIQIVNLSNTGVDSTTYNLSYIENRMREDGHLEIIQKPDSLQNIASPYLRFYPRTITLAPGETQVVKIQLMRTGELDRGEYRSHLYFRPVAKQEPLREEIYTTSGGLSISLKPIYGVSIANIILIDNPQFQIEIGDISVETTDQDTFLNMDFHRKGEASSFGDISVEYISPESRSTVVAEKKGFAVYTPGNLRKDRLRLKIIEGENYNEGKIIVRYRSQGPEKTILAEKSLNL